MSKGFEEFKKRMVDPYPRIEYLDGRTGEYVELIGHACGTIEEANHYMKAIPLNGIRLMKPT